MCIWFKLIFTTIKGHAPDLTLPETFTLYLETRFYQLDATIQLELWQESFKTIDDIRLLMRNAKDRPLKQNILVTFYQQLCKVAVYIKRKAYPVGFLGVRELSVPCLFLVFSLFAL